MALTIRRGYQDGKTGKVLTEYLHGIATLGEDEFAVIGLETDDTTPIEFYLRIETARPVRLNSR